jgi:hypothetical protein
LKFLNELWQVMQELQIGGARAETMRSIFAFVLAGAMMAGLTPTSAQAPPAPRVDPNAPVYVVAYIDVMPSLKTAAISAFKQFRDACRKERQPAAKSSSASSSPTSS